MGSKSKKTPKPPPTPDPTPMDVSEDIAKQQVGQNRRTTKGRAWSNVSRQEDVGSKRTLLSEVLKLG